MIEVLHRNGFTYTHDQDNAKVYFRAGMGFIAVLPDGTWHSSYNRNGKGAESLCLFILTAFVSHKRLP